MAKEFVMSRALIICTIAAALTVPVAARQTVAPPADVQATTPPSADALREQRAQMANFEVLLQAALKGAVQKFGQWVLQVAPSVYVTQVASPTVQGFPLPDGDVVFTVQHQPAELVGTQILSLQLQQPGGRPKTAAPAGPGTVVGQTGAPGGGIVEADPMKGGPVPAPAPAEEGCSRVTLGPTDPNQKYSDCVKEALINAMLDNSVFLSLKAGRTLQIVDIPTDSSAQNQVYSGLSKKLILSIQSEDLKAFHDGKITRDEAKRRIDDKRF